MQRLLRLFSSPSLQQSGIGKLQRQQLLWMLLLRVILYTLLLGITYIFNEMEFGIIVLPKSVLTLLLLVVYISSIFSALVLTKSRVNLQRFGFSQSLLDTLFACCLIYFTGISSSIFTSVFFFPIISGGLILPRKGGLMAAAAATLLYGVILFLEYQRIVPDYFFFFNFSPLQSEVEFINLFAIKGLTFFLAALLSAMFGLRLSSTEEVLSDTIQSFDKLSHLYKTIFDNISTGIVTANDQHIITSANAAAQKITGLALNDFLGKDLHEIFPNLDLNSKIVRQSTDFVKKDGTEIRIGYSLTSFPRSTEDQAKTKKNTPSKEESMLLTLQDIGEIEKMERKLRQGEKMAAIGMMSAGIAHDFRNPLTAISGSAQMLAREFSASSSPEKKEDLALTHIILRESNRLITTISDFLEFARPDVANRQWFSLINCIEEVLQLCRANPSWPATAALELDIDSRMDIWADEKQFFTVMSHLLHNSIAFCPEGNEKMRIHAEEITLGNNKEVLQVSVEDNGPGIAEDMREKIFEPFYTNRANGTGLGLAIVQQIAEGHKGSIKVSESSLGGAKFTFTLPYL